jgi:hypothetical protein
MVDIDLNLLCWTEKAAWRRQMQNVNSQFFVGVTPWRKVVSVALEGQGVGIIALIGLDSLIVVVQTPLDMESCLRGSSRPASSAAENVAIGEDGLLGRSALPSIVPGGVRTCGPLAIPQVVDYHEVLIIFVIVHGNGLFA